MRQLVLQHLAGLALEESSALEMMQGRVNENARVLDMILSMAFQCAAPLIRQEAFNCLINLSSHPTVALSLMQAMAGIVGVACEPSPFAERACMLLSNLSKQEEGRKAIWPHWNALLVHFHQQPYLSSVLADLTADAEGREWLWQGDFNERLYPLCVEVLNDPSIIRRGGALTALYNCLHDCGQHARLLLHEQQHDGRLTALLVGRLAGPESSFDADDLDRMPLEISLEFRHQPVEVDLLLRLRVCECLLLLCSTWMGREHLRTQHIYPILREWHRLESDEEVKMAAEKVVEMIIRDDRPESDTPEQ